MDDQTQRHTGSEQPAQEPQELDPREQDQQVQAPSCEQTDVEERSFVLGYN